MDPVFIKRANNQIIEDLRARRFNHLNLSPPSTVAWDAVSTFSYQWGRKSQTIDEPSLASFHGFLAEHELLPELTAEALQDTGRLHALDSDGKRMETWPLNRCLSGELTFGPETYVLDDGAFLAVARDYLRELNGFVSGVPAPPHTFPKTRRGENEGAYNERLAGALPGAILLDKQTVSRPQATAIEVCDVVMSSRHLIHVKKGTSSSSLSHLFAQGVVSADLLHMDEDFRDKVRHLFSKKLVGTGARRAKDFGWLHQKQFEPHLCEVEFVVMTERAGNMRREKLPFFSKVNLRMRCHELRRMGFKYSIALVAQ
jgi:uncharacterized protein (TIGR04141 family)